MRFLSVLLVLGALASAWASDRKKKKEEETQVLQLPKEPPATATVETKRLVFHVSPLSAKGLLSQQARDALRSLARSTGSASIVKLRAFVAGSGDLRRVRDIVSETFTERRQPLPVLSIVQVGALPLEGAQVVLESTAVAKKEVHPHGLAYISGQGATSDKPLDPVPPLAEKSLASLRVALRGAGSEPADVLRVTCFLSSLDGLPEVRRLFGTAFPSAALNYVQLQRAPARTVAECEAVARLHRDVSGLEFINPEGLPRSAAYSQVALVGAPRVVLSGTQQSFGFQDSDARLAFERLEKSLAQAGASLKQVAFSHLYPLSAGIAEQIRKVRVDFYDSTHPPASTMLLFEGLPSMDAGFAVDVVAIAK